jgi:methylamine---glutamate N-methyltransferase subunit B
VDDSRASSIPADVVLSIPEIRDYRAINGELVRRLDQGCRSIRLTGAGGQRLLVARLVGPWSAVIEVVGDAGPELAAEMEAPAVSVVCRGSVADGGASGLKCGRVLVLGRTGPAFGYSQRGGLAMVVGTAGCRAGLCQLGGDLILIGRAGALAGERQVGGRFLAIADLGPHGA